VRKVEGRTLREVTVKIGLERIDTHVIRRKCGQTLGLGLEQIRYSSSYIISLL